MAKNYQGQNKIYYVFYNTESGSCFSGTLQMCQDFMSTKSGSYSLDHRAFRPEYK